MAWKAKLNRLLDSAKYYPQIETTVLKRGIYYVPDVLIFRQYPQYISGNYIYHNRGMCSSKYFLRLFRSVDVIQHGRRVLNKCCSTSSVASCGSGLLFHGLWWKARTVTGLYDVTDVTVVYVTGYISATNSVDIAQRKRMCRYMYVVFLLMQKY